MHLITSHHNTDFDSLASMVAAQKLFPDAVMCPPGSLGRKVKDFMSHYGHKWNLLKPKKVPVDQVTKMIVVDTRARGRIGTFAALAGRQDVEVVIFDHHPPTIDDIPAGEMHYAHIGATVTMLVERLIKERKSISPEEATLFALGIYDDTGALTYEATTARDIAAVAHLREMGADLSRILSRAEVSMSAGDVRLLDTLAENAYENYINGAKVLLTWAQTDEYVEGLSLFVHRLRDYYDSQITIAVVCNGGKKVNIIVRSAPGILNVKDFLAPYGGSGHLQAGSATVLDRDPQEVLTELEASLEHRIPPLLKVGSVMTSPVLAMQPDASVDEAYRTMLRFGHQALPVVGSDGAIVGIMTRKDLDKAHLHGLDRAQISDFMTEGVISISTDASIEEAHRMMATYSFERLPVLDCGRLIGILTRADLVRALYKVQPAGERETYDGFLWMESVAELMESSFDDGTLELLRRIGRKAESMGMKAYLVGGTVRDILLGVKNIDIDISVEGDAEKLVKAWDEIGCRSTVHGRYKTGTIIFPDGRKVDVATARREFYEYAAAQPTIESDSLKQDLGRRDFTVNAMSVSLSEADWGTLTDNFGGRADLRDGILKILHNLSFVEDPSRILRGVRLEQRLGMHFEDNTMRLLRSALKGGLLGFLSNPRVRTELELDAAEPCFDSIVMRMEELGILESLLPGIKTGEESRRRLRIMRYVMMRARLHGVDFRGMEWLVGMAVILTDSPVSTRSALMDRLCLTQAERGVLTECFSAWPQTERFCSAKKQPRNSEIYTFFKGFGPVHLFYWLTCAKTPRVRRCIAMYVLTLSQTKCLINGDDLLSMGFSGRSIGDVLNAVRLARMDGEVCSREDELSFAEAFLNIE